MSFDHHGQVAFITGAGAGIGRATAARLAAEGARVGVVDRDQDGAAETVESIQREGGTALAAICDVRDRTAVRGARDAVVDRFGPITQLVNSAGLITMEDLERLTDESWDLVLDVNLKGTWLVTQVVSEVMAAGGSVVNLTSVEGEVIVSSKGFAQVHYNASKGGVKMLTKALAVELAKKHFRVTAVAPGPVATDIVSLEGVTSPEAMEFLGQRLLIPRIGQPADIAAAISFLLSPEASWITGTQLAVDGGWLTR